MMPRANSVTVEADARDTYLRSEPMQSGHDTSA